MRPGRQVAELDGVRGIAISGVLLLHFVSGASAYSAVERAIQKVTSYGLFGVDLFFVLSGFLITGILYDSKGDPHYFRNFYARRTLRIFPLYYAVLLVLMLLIPSSVVASAAPELAGARENQIWLWPYLTNVYVAKAGGFTMPYVSHFWTLAIEEHFYLMWPLIVAVTSRKGAMRVSLVLSVLALTLRVGLVAGGAGEIAAQTLTPCRFDSLCCGAWFALAARGPGGVGAVVARFRSLLPISAGLVLALSIWHTKIGLGDALVLPLRVSACAVLFGIAIVIAVDDAGPPLIKRALCWGWLRTLGKYSYGLYIYHGLIDRHFAYRGFEERLTRTLGSHGLAVLALAGGGIALSLLISIASFELFEKPFLKLKRYFEARAAA
jgi:peptidoglycan/LPS O-acetylase OafA/YrhL